ncbi:hypothetical protein J6590_013867 [Homalodisca vitripennis]|nr:hypothetical protein J6590_013867 [Homalodisca vitripennis]
MTGVGLLRIHILNTLLTFIDDHPSSRLKLNAVTKVVATLPSKHKVNYKWYECVGLQKPSVTTHYSTSALCDVMELCRPVSGQTTQFPATRECRRLVQTRIYKEVYIQ